MTRTSHHFGVPAIVLVRPWKWPVPPAFAAATAAFASPLQFTVPEVRPGAAPDGLEVADLHDALAALAHEDEVAVEVEHLDAVVRGGEHAVA